MPIPFHPQSRGRAGPPRRPAVALLLALTLVACAASPTLPPQAERAASAADRVVDTQSAAAAGKVVAARVDVRGARGRLSAAQREALLHRLADAGESPLLQRHLLAMSELGEAELVAGNRARLLIDGPQTFDAVFKAVEAARRSVLVESYIVEDVAIARRLGGLLRRKAAQGLEVALLYDAVGSFGTDAAFFDALRRDGVQVCAYNPPGSPRARDPQWPTRRNHRKTLVIDGTTAFTGGINISAVYASGSFGRSRRADPPAAADEGWRDTQVQLAGPAAREFDSLVRGTWRAQGCPGALGTGDPPARGAAEAGGEVVRVVPSSPDDPHSRIYTLLMAAFDTARRSIHLTMAYFAPGDELVEALCEAAARGVDVQLVLPAHSDFKPVLHAGRARYDRLLRAGVRIHEFQGSVLHAKTAVIDGVWSTVGSSNLDYRSLVANDEINLVVVGEPFGRAMQRMFERDVAASRPVQLAEWRERPWIQRLTEGAAHLLERWW